MCQVVVCKHRIPDQYSDCFLCVTALKGFCFCGFVLIIHGAVYLGCFYLAVVSDLSCVEEDFAT